MNVFFIEKNKNERYKSDGQDRIPLESLIKSPAALLRIK